MDKHEWYMAIAETVSLKSPDEETKVGSILVNKKTGAVIATGFNGFVRGAPDAFLPKIRPQKHDYMVHSEINLIANCAKHGISMDECIIYCTLSPCVNCMRALYQAGIEAVVVKDLYKDFDQLKDLRDLTIESSKLKNTGFTLLKYYPLSINGGEKNVD